MGMPPSFGRMQMLLLVTLLLVVVPLSIHSGTGSSPLVSAFTQSYLNPQRHAFSLLCTARKNEAKRSTSSYCFGTSFRRRHLTSLNSYSEVSDTQEEEKQSEKIPTTSSKGWSSTLSDQKNSFARAAATAAVSVALLTATLLPQSANAGFGPSGGATTSQTPLQSVKENAVESLSFDKLTQLIDSNMRGAGLSSLADQINSLVETLTLQEQQEEQDLQNFQMEPDTSKYMSVEEYKEKEQERLKQERERLQKARTLQQQIVKRTSMLEKLEAQPVWFNYFAAFIGSVVSTSIMHPVDTIKTRIMMNSGEDELDFDELVNWNSSMIENVTESSYDMTPTYDRVDDSGVATLVATNTTTKTLTDHHTQHHLSTFTSTSTESTHSLIELKDTVLNLYEGLPGNILKEGPASALYLGVYEIVKVKLLTTTGIGSAVGASDAVGPLLLIYLTAGAAGETIGSTIRAPAEALKSLVQTGLEPSVPLAAKRVFGTPEGRANTFKAWSASVCRDVPFGSIQLAIFELVKIFILNSPYIQWDAGTLQAEAIIGAFAGGIGSFLTTPADVITTRIITQETREGEEGLGIIDMAQKVYEEEGSQAFVAGWEQRVLYWAPAISIFLTCYCSVRQVAIGFEWF